MAITGSISNSVRDLLNETAWQQSIDLKTSREISYSDEVDRNVGSLMGKESFLNLLVAQLRNQDPLDPQSDSEFAAQLAQFSSLEQMQNMNETLTAMAGYQSYSLVGKYVIATASVDGMMTEIPGVVESVFTRNNRAFAQIGEYVVPISAITDVFDNSTLVTPETLIQTSNNLIGRTVMAQIGNMVYEGEVTRITVDKGLMYAMIDDGIGDPRFVPVGSIFDIRQPGTSGTEKPGDEADPPEGIDPPEETDPPEGIDPPVEENP